MSKKISCSHCKRTFTNLNAYLWHLELPNTCVPPAPPPAPERKPE